MKKLLLSLLLFSFLVSCGPHRMGCGARGICNSVIKGELVKKHS
ncbi:MAG: hypothetical protein ABI426_10215 [Flavobacterium sp.]